MYQSQKSEEKQKRSICIAKVSICHLAQILTIVQQMPKFQEYEISFTQKTKGGISISNKSGHKTQIIEGVQGEIWPFLVEDSLAIGKRKTDFIFDLSQPCISGLQVREKLQQDLDQIASEMLSCIEVLSIAGFCIK